MIIYGGHRDGRLDNKPQQSSSCNNPEGIYFAMAEADAPVPNSDVMEGILSTSEATAEEPSAAPEDEYTCETLYIQNLNEKIKPEGSVLYWL